MESLTEELYQSALAIITEFEKTGGMVKAVERGIPKKMIEECAARKQARIDSGNEVQRLACACAERGVSVSRSPQVIVGVNKYTVANEAPPPVRVIDNSAVLKAQVAAAAAAVPPHVQQQQWLTPHQVAKLEQVKSSRDPVRAAKALDGVRVAAADSSLNLLGEHCTI